MKRALFLIPAGLFFRAIPRSRAQSPPGAASAAPLRVALSGLTHGHADGFFARAKDRRDVQVIGIAEPDRKLFDRYAAKFGLEASLWHDDLDEMLSATRPQAVLVYTNTFDHRRAGESGEKPAGRGMMETPRAVSSEEGRPINRAAKAGKIAVLVNYET